jgi:hypothetical protein
MQKGQQGKEEEEEEGMKRARRKIERKNES